MTKTVDNLTDPAFVVYGIDADRKPRAARFDNSHPELVAKAAELMNLTSSIRLRTQRATHPVAPAAPRNRWQAHLVRRRS